MSFYRTRAQSAGADGARARNRTGLFEYDYEQEHEHEHEKARAKLKGYRTLSFFPSMQQSTRLHVHHAIAQECIQETLELSP
jgi:hypothetical protein